MTRELLPQDRLSQVSRPPATADELFGVRGKCVLITGGVHGIGRAIAEAFLHRGARVVVTSRDANDCADATRELTALGDGRAITADLATAAGCRALAEALAEWAGRLDVLVNNAGAQYEETLAHHDPEAWDRVHDVNVKAPFLLAQAFAPMLRSATHDGSPARIIMIGSISALRTSPREIYAYSASKAAQHHLARHLAKQLAPDVTVNVIAVGMYVTGLRVGGVASKRDPALLTAVPMARFTQPEDVAGTALFLASAAGSYLTGAVIPVDGGASTTL